MNKTMQWIKKFYKNNMWIESIITVSILGICLTLFGGKGFLGWLAFILILAAWRLIRRWEVFKTGISTTMKYTEGTIFGKPLDKELWDKGELRNTKVKVVWKKKKKHSQNGQKEIK